MNDPSKGDIECLRERDTVTKKWMDLKELAVSWQQEADGTVSPIPAGREMQPQRKTEEQVLALSVLESISSSPL